ncbi:MAG TPA: thermonuclease family protein [Stellaceae bacterium]|nr:thermonuclease family protein [Stellaceae bacterium]
MKSLRTLSLAGIATVALIVGLAASRHPFGPSDRYHVIDGDTLELEASDCLAARLGVGCVKQRVRLYGVDAFELEQNCRDAQGQTWPCGRVAAQRLTELVNTPEFACHVDQELMDSRAREFAICLAGGQDVGEVLVREGLAVAYGRGTRYIAFEEVAKREGRGAWAGRFVRPQYFRRGATD